MITWIENSRACPPPESLRQYADGWADEATSLLLEEHLSKCEACSSAIEFGSNPSDQWIQAIRTKMPTVQAPVDVSADGQKSDTADSHYEEIDPIVQQAIETSKRMLESTGSSASQDRDVRFRETPPNLGEIGPYQLLRPIGQGGMGYVMLARHKHLDKEVAVKILPRTPWLVPSEEVRFQREVRAVGKLEHPSIVTALDAGEYEGTHFLAMEYVDGLDLSRLAKAIGPLSIADACELIRQTALGLSYAHAQGIVHRDIKPSNLMLDRSGRVKILDFGLAQLQPWDDGCADLTSVGQLMGTLDYMAPEQAEHGGAVSYRADLYSLGATLFRLLVGRAPLAITPTQTPLEKLRLLADHPIPHLRTMLSIAPSELCEIVDSLLSRDASVRPPSAAHLAERLAPFATGFDLVGLLRKAQEITDKQESTSTPPSLLLSGRNLRTSSPSTSLSPSTQSASNKRRWNWIGWTAAALFAPLAALGGFFIYLETQKGQVIVESEVAEVRVRVVSDGKDVDELQLTQGVKSVRLRAGKYELLLDSPTDSVTMSNQTFVLKNGETIVARVSRKEIPIKDLAPSSPSLPLAPSALAESKQPIEVSMPNTPQYDGKSLNEWLAVLDRERDYTKVDQSLTAIEALATRDDSERIRKSLDEQVQRFSNYESIIGKSLQIEKKLGDKDDFGSRAISIVRATDEDALKSILDGGVLRQTLKDDHLFAKVLMSLKLNEENDQLTKKVTASILSAIQTESDFNMDELGQYLDRIFSSPLERRRLLAPKSPTPKHLQVSIDSLVLRVLRSSEASPQEKADVLSYLLAPDSFARVRADALPWIESLLGAMSGDEQLRSAEVVWSLDNHGIAIEASERSKEYDSLFRSTSYPHNLPFGIFMLRFLSATNLAKELSLPLRDLASSYLKAIQPVAPELLTFKVDSIDLKTWESISYTLKAKPRSWKRDYLSFLASVRLLQSLKLSNLKDLCPEATMKLDENIWSTIYVRMPLLDTDRSGDIDKAEMDVEKSYDFSAVDKDGDGYVTDVELYYNEIRSNERQIINHTVEQLDALNESVEMYTRQVGKRPNTLRALWKQPNDVPVNIWVQILESPIESDPWGTPYQYQVDGSKIRLRSFGPDRQENTDDDIFPSDKK